MTFQEPAWPFLRADALPPYAFVTTDAAKAKVIAAGADLIDLGLGNPDRGTPQEIVDVLHASADVPRNHRYHPGRGLVELREACAAWYARRYSATLDPTSEIIITMGAKEGMSHLCFAILGPGDVTIAPDPCYPIHAGAPRIAGSDVEFYAAREGLAPAVAVAEASSGLLLHPAMRRARKAAATTRTIDCLTFIVAHPCEMPELTRHRAVGKRCYCTFEKVRGRTAVQ